MPEKPEFPEYSTIYSKQVRPFRDTLSPELRSTLDKIEDDLAENPDAHPQRIHQLDNNIFVYQHPDPQIEITFKVDRKRKIIYFLHVAAPRLPMSKQLFISYSHTDEKWLLELKKWLKPLEESNLISIWDDQDIKPGENWRKKIKTELARAKAAILLVSQDFLASKFITEHELPSLLDDATEKGLVILWIAVRPSTVDQSPIAKYQAVHKEPSLCELEEAVRDREFKKILEKIKEVVE